MMNNNQKLENRRVDPVTLSRHESVSDLKITCQVGCFLYLRDHLNAVILFQDGVTFAHQFILGRHSRYLKKLFAQSYSIENVSLMEPKCNGLERRIKVS